MLYARALFLRNCGRFTHVSSDFGSQYHTHTFVTSEALYASLTRGVTWRHEGRFVDLKSDATKSARADYFVCDYDVSKKPIWFTPGVFVDEQLRPLAKERGVVDKNDFNVVDEGYPSTGGGGRAYYVPTYGRIESVLPDHRLLTFAFSSRCTELEDFTVGQTFMLGKKRTMMQLVQVAEVVEGEVGYGCCATGWYLELPPDSGQLFGSFEVLAATMRYLLLRGTSREEVKHIVFRHQILKKALALPDFYLTSIPIEVEL